MRFGLPTWLAPDDDRDHDLGATFDGTEIRYYVDGKRVFVEERP